MSTELIEAAKAPILAFNAADWDAAAACLAPNATYDELATARKFADPDAILESWKGWKTAFSDCRGEFQRAQSSGSTAVFELLWLGTHDGPLLTEAGEIPATGNAMKVRACAIIDVVDGKVESFVHYFDLATLLRQLGLG